MDDEWTIIRTISFIRTILEQNPWHSDREYLEGLESRLKDKLEDIK